MRHFTRPLTREVNVGGTRLALTFRADGLEVRPVGSRKPPLRLSWDAVVCACVESAHAGEPGEAETESAVAALKAGVPEPAAEPPAALANVSNHETLPNLLARLDRWLATNRPHYADALREGATAADLAALEKALGRPLPEELKTLLRWHDGQDPERLGALEEDWVLLGTQGILAAKQDKDAEAAPGWRREFLPVCSDDADSYLCLELTKPGPPLVACWRGKHQAEPVAASLTAWLTDFVGALERGDYTEDSERGGMHRR